MMTDADSQKLSFPRAENGNDRSKNNGKFFVNYRDGKYEISSFLKNHPGGQQVLKAFKNSALDSVLDTVPHSEAAFHLFKDFELSNKRAYGDIENLIDWNAPLLSQVGSLQHRYWEWVNLPVDRPIRLFKSDVLEFTTLSPWYLIPIIWIPVLVYFLYHGLLTDISGPIGNSMHKIILTFLWGILMWTFFEYVLHRGLFHLRPPADSKILISLHFLFHGLHHKAPFDHRRLVFPPLPGILGAFALYNLYKVLFSSMMVNIISSGTMAGYLCYDLIHYYLHHGAPSPNTYFYKMKRYHNYHHFLHHDQGFGISSTLWDYIFGSLIVLRQLKKAIIW